MWLLTPLGFFSIVRKPGMQVLTVRSRAAGDLDRLRARYLPSLTPTVRGAGTDYPCRATCTAAAWGDALAALGRDIDYHNFKGVVATRQGPDRARIYHRVWSELCAIEREEERPMKNASCGGVLIDEQGRVLLRTPSNGFGGDRWTFPKGRPEPGESGEQAALREVREETGYDATIVAPVPGSYEGETTENRYWLMRPQAHAQAPHWETEQIRWCTPAEARALIAQTPSATKRRRDLAVLEAALELEGRKEA